MARMIPPVLPKDSPAGEAFLFRKLRDDPGTKNWIVLHSFSLQRMRKKVEGELDLVVLVPGSGVLGLEVKGCDVRRRDGLWIYPYATSSEGPFKQASKATYALRKHVAGRDASLAPVLYWSGVVFTQIDFRELSSEWHGWQVIDQSLLARQPISAIIVELLAQAHDHVAKTHEGKGWHSPTRSRPDPAAISRIASILRPDFDYAASPRTDVARLEQSLLRFTEDQYAVLDAMADNRRLVIKGLAGTGKTLLGIEAARRAARDGAKVLLLCYNRLLSEWMKAQVAGDAGIECGSFHGLLREIVGSPPPAGSGDAYWRQELPALALEQLLSERRVAPYFDCLIVDEAQDLAADDYLDVMDVLVAGGLAGGVWNLFGDFENQAIYNMGETPAGMLARLKKRAPDAAAISLSVNCRNASPIAETLTLACSVSPGYSRYLHDMEGAGVDPLFWADGSTQRAALAAALDGLRGIYSPSEIVVLSPKADEACCAAELGRDRPDGRLAPLRGVGAKSAIRYATIHAFKGLESPAVVVTDIEHFDDATKALLYVAMSRARIRLVLLMRESCRGEYMAMLTRGLGVRRRGADAA